ncbi:MAG: hypothetical protein CVV41_16350 [Candidatus Riflebacteria bacterium HGW-Riflebacteria-1]|jgi:hypothetical protein|nr:MAG: hypothetical protein CVV41_16350 [Candidatus Riflebacteria bacterium HGW-Riflebacteria-1]
MIALQQKTSQVSHASDISSALKISDIMLLVKYQPCSPAILGQNQQSFCASRQAKSQNPLFSAFLDPATALRFAQDDE